MSDFPQNLSPLKAVTELRAVCEGFASRYAAIRAARGADTSGLLAAFRRLQDATESGDYERLAKADKNLHREIVLLANVAGLEDTFFTINRELDAFRTSTIRDYWPDLNTLFESHRQIVDTICAGDPLAAEEAAHAHIEAIWYRLAEHTSDPSLPNSPLDQVRTYMAFNLHEPLQLQFLAKYIAKTSVGHLARLFREEIGKSFTEYLRDLRLRRAVKTLTQSSQSIGQIAKSVGYLDASRFSRHFANQFGMTPREYRKRFGGRIEG